jgi:hypothetical protein
MTTQLTQDEYDVLEDNLGAFGEIMRYSGRAMYGAECLGIATDNEARALFNLGIALAQDDSAEARRLINIMHHGQWRSDSLGRDSAIVYFSSIKLPDGVLSDEDEE